MKATTSQMKQSLQEENKDAPKTYYIAPISGSAFDGADENMEDESNK